MDIIYDEFMGNWISSNIDLQKDDFKVLLVNSSYKPKESHKFNDIINFEIKSLNYEAGGQCIRLEYKNEDKNTIIVSPSSSHLKWYNLTASVRFAIVYKLTEDHKNILISCLDLDEDLKESESIILKDDTIVLSWPDDFIKIDKYIKPPEPPTEEEMCSGVLNLGFLNKIKLNVNYSKE